MGLRQGLAQIQADTGAILGVAGLVIAVEQPGEIPAADLAPAVEDGKGTDLLDITGKDAGIGFGAFQRDGDVPAIRSVLERVGQQVVDDLPEPASRKRRPRRG